MLERFTYEISVAGLTLPVWVWVLLVFGILELVRVRRERVEESAKEWEKKGVSGRVLMVISIAIDIGVIIGYWSLCWNLLITVIVLAP